MNLEEAHVHVKREVDAIFRRDGGLMPRPYIVVEVLGRAKTWKLEGVGKGPDTARELRKLVEKVCDEMAIKPKKKPILVVDTEEFFDDQDPSVYATNVGAIKVKKLPKTG